MKILITTDLYTVKTNGVVTSVDNLFHGLLNRGYDVRILTLSQNEISYQENGIYYIKSFSLEKIYPEVRGTITYKSPLVEELIQWRPDVIHSQCEFFTFEYAKYISRKTGAKIVHTYHTMYEDYVGYVTHFERFGKAFIRDFTKIRLRNAETIIAPTYKTLEVLERYGLKNDIQVVPTGICLDQHFKEMTSEQRDIYRNRYGIKENDFVLISLGRCAEEKRIDVIIRALKALKQDGIKLLIVGDGPAKNKLEHLSESLGLSGSVIFTGAVSPEEVQNYYKLADVFVSASTSETQGLVFIEACANGLPLVCWEDPCLENIIQQGKNGYTVNSICEFVNVMRRIKDDSSFIENAGLYSKEVATYFDQSHFVDKMETIYHRVWKQNMRIQFKQEEVTI